nr:MATE family efflux transporter [Lachnospiraceae bacterium]
MHEGERRLKKETTKDMTNGNPTGLIVGFAIPLLLGNLFQQLYNMIDTMIVGRYLGVNALAGVGATGSINFLIVG